MSENFNHLYENINKINDLANKVPEKYREAVFEKLFQTLVDGNIEENIYKKEIIEMAEHSDLPIEDFINIDLLKSNIDKSLMFVYYLETINLQNISESHIRACYELCGFEVPNMLSQNLRDLNGSKKYGYLTVIDNGYKTTDIGKEICKRKNLLKIYAD